MQRHLTPYFSHLALIVVTFPAFTDGRSYSVWPGNCGLMAIAVKLRATGNILPDQLQFMLQVGIDSFEVAERFPLEAWQQAAQHYAAHLSTRPDNALAMNAKSGRSAIRAFAAWEEQPHAG